MQVEKREIKNLNINKQGRGKWDDPMLAIPRKRMRIARKRCEKHVRRCTPYAQNGGGTSARPKIVVSNFHREK